MKLIDIKNKAIDGTYLNKEMSFWENIEKEIGLRYETSLKVYEEMREERIRMHEEEYQEERRKKMKAKEGMKRKSYYKKRNPIK